MYREPIKCEVVQPENNPTGNFSKTNILRPSVRGLCPFSWSEFHRDTLPGCLFFLGWLVNLLGGSTIVRVIEQVPCSGEKCQMWDRSTDNCIFMNIKNLGSTAQG